MSPRPSKKVQILDAAVEVFTVEGYARTSMDVVADRAGVTKQTIYNNFRTKDELFIAATRAVLEQIAGDLVELISGMPGTLRNPVEELTELAVRWVQQFLEPRAAALRRLVIAEVEHHPQLLHHWVAAGPGRIDVHLAVLLERWSATGALHIPDAALAARQLRTLVTAEPWNRSAFGTVPLDEDAVRALVEPNVKLFVGAFGQAPAEA